MKKVNVTQILGYILFAIAAYMLIGMFFNTSVISRTSKYYEEKVYNEHYKYYDQNSDYLDAYLTAGNGFYDKDPIYTYKQNDTTVSDLQFSLNVYRTRVVRTSYKLYFFKQQTSSDGYVIEIKDLKYKGEDLMGLNDEYNTKEVPNHLFRVYLRFDPAVLPHVKESDSKGAYAYTLSPKYPAIIDKGLLQIDKDTLAELIEIRVVHVPLDAEKNPIEDNKETLFVVNSDNNKFYGDNPIYVHDLDLSVDKYTFTKTEVSGLFPTETEVQAQNLSYQKLDLSPYNGGVVLSVVIITFIVLLAAYFMFFNKFVVARVQEKRAEKRLTAKQAESMNPQVHQEAIFSDTPEEGEVVEANFDDSEESDKTLN